MKNLKYGFLAGVALMALSMSAFADSITYNYVGNPLTVATAPDGYTVDPVEGATRMTASVTFSGALAASLISTGTLDISYSYLSTIGYSNWNPDLSFSISDGVSTLTQDTANVYSVSMSIVDGIINNWYIGARTFTGSDGSQAEGDIDLAINSATESKKVVGMTSVVTFEPGQMYHMVDNGPPNSWTQGPGVSAVPVPATLPLLASAVGLFGFARRRFA